MADLSQRIQDAIVILCTSLYAADKTDPLVQSAADILCRDLTRTLTGAPPSDKYFRAVSQLGEAIADGKWTGLEGVPAEEILMGYDG